MLGINAALVEQVLHLVILETEDNVTEVGNGDKIIHIGFDNLKFASVELGVNGLYLRLKFFQLILPLLLRKTFIVVYLSHLLVERLQTYAQSIHLTVVGIELGV